LQPPAHRAALHLHYNKAFAQGCSLRLNHVVQVAGLRAEAAAAAAALWRRHGSAAAADAAAAVAALSLNVGVPRDMQVGE